MAKQIIKDEKSRNLTYKKRMVSIKKKTAELATLCGIKVCTVVFGPHGEIDTWPEKPADLRNVVDMYKYMSTTLKTKAKTETDNGNNMDEKVVKILDLERETADAKRENWRKIVRLVEAMNRVVSDRTEFLKAEDERQGKAEGDVIAVDERLTMEEKKADSLGKDNIIGKEPIVVNSANLMGYRDVFGSILMDMLLNVGGKSNCMSKSEE